MTQRVTMPLLGESVTEGTIVRWLKAVGERVEFDEPLVEVSTDKVDTEIPSPVAGTLREVLAQEDDTVPIGADLAVIVADGAEAEPEPVAAGSTAEQQSPADSAAAPDRSADSPARTESARGTTTSGGAAPARSATPLVRKLAAEHGVDLATVIGTGANGRIRKEDVLAAAKANAAAGAPRTVTANPTSPRESAAGGAAPRDPAAREPAPRAPRPGAVPTPATSGAKRGTRVPMSRMRKVIAERMRDSLQVSAQLTTIVEADLTRVARLRKQRAAQFEAREGLKLGFMPFVALAAVEALKAHPEINARIDGDDVVYHSAEHLSVAVDTPKGLMVPVIRNAGELNIAGLTRSIADLAARARSGDLTPDEVSGGTFTLTNTGSRGALIDTPIINQPQVAILGTGTVAKRPAVVTDVDGEETIAIRSMMYLCLTYDHRLVDGADAARYLETVKNRLEAGAFPGIAE